jgi:hypothetical protein
MCRDRHTSTLAMVAMAAILVPSTLTAQTTFQRTYGGPATDEGRCVQQTADGGYVIAGGTHSSGAGSCDVYLIKTDARGDVVWTRTYGGAAYDEGFSVQQTFDGGYIIAGYTSGSGLEDFYLIRTNANGDTLWTRTFGDDPNDVDLAYQVQQTADSGFIVVGCSFLDGHGNVVVRVVKTDAAGNTQWNRTYGERLEHGYSVRQTTDDGYIVVGQTQSFVSPGARPDLWLVRLDAAGDTLWTRTFGDTAWDQGNWVEQTADGGYVITGRTNYFGGAGITGDVYLVRTDADGNILWSSAYGGDSSDMGNSVQQVHEGVYAIAGVTSSFGAGGSDFYLIQTDADGDTLWTRTFGDVSYEWASMFRRTADGGYVIVGTTESFGAGGRDVWLIKTDSLGNVAVEEPQAGPTRVQAISLTCEPNPCRGQAAVRLSPFACRPAPLTLRVYDVSGGLVHSSFGIQTSPFQLDLGSMPAGAYFVCVDAGSSHAITRVVLQR